MLIGRNFYSKFRNGHCEIVLGSIMFHVRRRPADSQPRRRKKKPLSGAGEGGGVGDWGDGAALLEVGPHGQFLEGGRRIKVTTEPVEVGSASSVNLQIFGPMIQPRHCVIAMQENACTVTPLHADAPTFVNGHRINQTTVLHHGSVVMFGRVASFKYYDPQQDGRLSRHLAISQSQLDNASVYDRSPTSPVPDGAERPLSPLENGDEFGSPGEHKPRPHDMPDYAVKTHDGDQPPPPQPQQHQAEPSRDNFETTFDLDGNVETKSVGSAKSAGSNQDNRMNSYPRQGQELILPAVLEFPEPPQDVFLRHVITELDVNIPTFKLAPVYTLYLCARYRASTHYRPELQPTERAHKLTVLLHHIANIIQGVIKERHKDAKSLSFWMANSSEFLHFLKSDRHISAFSLQAQDVLAECVQSAFRYLVSCFHVDLSEMLGQFLSENIDHDSAAGLVLSVLGSVMALLRRCRVNAALTIQLFSQLFHYINVRCFNKVVTTPQMCSPLWGQRIQLRLSQLQQWAERQGLELAADCHLAKIVQCTHLLQAPKNIPDDISAINDACFKLNSLQMSALLRQCSDNVAPPLIEMAVRNAENVADELTRGDGREIRLEESPELPLALLLPDDGFSCDVVKGVPHGLVDFLQPLQAAGLCRLAVQPSSIGHWTVYMHQYHARSSSALSNKASQPEIQIIKLHKNSNGMGLSIVAAKGAGQDRLGIYIKSVVAGGAADLDQRLQAGDQLLRVDGQSLIGITQEKAAEYLMHTGSIVTLEVAKQGAIYHGLATLLQQPSPLLHRGPRRMSERDLPSRVGAEGGPGGLGKPPLPLPSSKSVPALHHVGSPTQEMLGSPPPVTNMKSYSTHNLSQNANHQGFQQQDQSVYQNLTVYRAGNNSQPNLGDRGSLLRTSQNSLQQKDLQGPVSPLSQRPASAYFGTQSQVPPSHQTNQSVHNLRSQSTKDIANFSRENQTQQSLRTAQNQSLTPSMPNISNNSQMMSGYNGQMASPGHAVPLNSSSMNQSMSNISHNFSHMSNNSPMNHSMSNLNQQYNSHGHSTPMSPNSNYPMHHMHPGMDQSAVGLSNSQRGLAKMAEMGEEVRRRQHRGPSSGPLSPNQARPMYTDSSSYPINNGLMSPTKQTPSTAPKPMMKRMTGPDDGPLSPPIPPTSTHPLYRGSSTQNVMHHGQNNSVTSTNMQYNQTYPGHHPMQSGYPGQQMPPYSPQNFAGNQQSLVQQQPGYGSQQFSNNTAQSVNSGPGYAASMADPPRVNFYPMNVQGTQGRPGFGANNPWEREEREKEMEARREQTRQWRDQQISELSSLPARTPQQEEQLRALKLEREFQRRAQEAENEEDTEQDKETAERVQGILRQAQQNSLNNQKSEPKLPQPVSSNIISSITPISVVSTKLHQEESNGQPSPVSNQMYNTNNDTVNTTPTLRENNAPKSILKQNMRLDHLNSVMSSPTKQNKNTHFAESVTPQSISFDGAPNSVMTTSTNVSHISKNLANMNLNRSVENLDSDYSQYNNSRTEYNVKYDYNQYKNDKNAEMMSPPPPPERNSSFQVMNQQTALRSSINSSVSDGPALNRLSGVSSTGTQQPTMQLTPQQQQQAAALLRDKRVSFNESDDVPPPPPLVASPPPDLDVIREDPDKFIIEAEGMLQSPQTPDATVTSTPGVIGAQEVYRDPRQKRLLEQQRQAQTNSTPIPEKLSFKEKMKMFALESGESQTPRDKLKISRAQRDIDAVH